MFEPCLGLSLIGLSLQPHELLTSGRQIELRQVRVYDLFSHFCPLRSYILHTLGILSLSSSIQGSHWWTWRANLRSLISLGVTVPTWRIHALLGSWAICLTAGCGFYNTGAFVMAWPQSFYKRGERLCFSSLPVPGLVNHTVVHSLMSFAL